MEGLVRLIEVLESLDVHVVALTSATKQLSAIEATGRRPRVVTDNIEQMEADFAQVFDELFSVDPDCEITRADIIGQLAHCANNEVSVLIDRYSLPNCRSKGYRAFIDHLRAKARRERQANGTTILVGLALRPISHEYSEKRLSS